jgi:hypothetical protein
MVTYQFPNDSSITYNVNSKLGIQYGNTIIVLPLKEEGISFEFQENMGDEDRKFRYIGKISNGLQYILSIREEFIGITVNISILYNQEYTALSSVFIDDETNEELINTLITLGRAVRDGAPLPEAQNGNLGNNNSNQNAILETRNLPVNAINTITYEPIANSTEMVNFHNEFGHGRYYTRETYNQMPIGPNGRKRNPYTQQNITEIRSYTGRIPAAAVGGRKQKTRSKRRSSRKTIKRRK